MHVIALSIYKLLVYTYNWTRGLVVIMTKHQACTRNSCSSQTKSAPEADTWNEMLVDTSSSSQPTSLDELHSPYDIGDVHHFAHSY